MINANAIGTTFPPFSFEISRSKIRELARAIGDPNPVYDSIEAAQAAGYRDVPLPPTFGTILGLWGETGSVERLRVLGIDMARALHGEEEYQYLAPIYPGDVLTGVTTLADAKTRSGSSGRNMEIYTIQTAYTNQHDQPVLRARHMVVIV